MRTLIIACRRLGRVEFTVIAVKYKVIHDWTACSYISHTTNTRFAEPTPSFLELLIHFVEWIEWTCQRDHS